MATFAVNRSSQFFLGLPRRSLLTSWSKRNYNSAGPVWHTSGRSPQERKPQKVTPLVGNGKKDSMLARSGVSNGGREDGSSENVAARFPVKSAGDGSLYEMSSFGTEPEYDGVFNNIGGVLDFEDSTVSEMDPMECEFVEESEQLFDEPQAVSVSILSKGDKGDFDKVKDNAERMAFELLATRSLTTVELCKKLRGKKYPPDVVESVIIELKSRGLLNDGLYAESFSQSRWSSSSWGPRRIKRALLQKGVNEADIDKATNLVFRDSDTSSSPQDAYLGMSKISMDHLFAQASKQWLRGQNVSLEKRRSRMLRWLQYRGFDWGVTNFILKKIESKYPP